jgi:hypothetical protein
MFASETRIYRDNGKWVSEQVLPRQQVSDCFLDMATAMGHMAICVVCLLYASLASMMLLTGQFRFTGALFNDLLAAFVIQPTLIAACIWTANAVSPKHFKFRSNSRFVREIHPIYVRNVFWSMLVVTEFGVDMAIIMYSGIFWCAITAFWWAMRKMKC